MHGEGTLHEWLLVLHVLAAMAWVGGTLVLNVMSLEVLRSSDPAALSRFTETLRFVGPRVLAPATVLVLGLGIWLVIESDEWGFDQGWVLLALGLFAVTFLVGAVFQSRTAIRAGRAAASGMREEAAHALRRWSQGAWLILLLLVITTWDMVFKPGA